MFEELYRDRGVLRIPTGVYCDGKPAVDDIPVLYFSRPVSYRDPAGVMQSDTVIYCKPAVDGIDIPPDCAADTVFADNTGKCFSLNSCAYVVDLFSNQFECVKLVVSK